MCAVWVKDGPTSHILKDAPHAEAHAPQDAPRPAPQDAPAPCTCQCTHWWSSRDFHSTIRVCIVSAQSSHRRWTMVSIGVPDLEIIVFAELSFHAFMTMIQCYKLGTLSAHAGIHWCTSDLSTCLVTSSSRRSTPYSSERTRPTLESTIEAARATARRGSIGINCTSSYSRRILQHVIFDIFKNESKFFKNPLMKESWC